MMSDLPLKHMYTRPAAIVNGSGCRVLDFELTSEVFEMGSYAQSDSVIKMFYEKVGPAKELSVKAKGILIFPDVIKAGFGLGGEYGEGVLRINGKTVEY